MFDSTLFRPVSVPYHLISICMLMPPFQCFQSTLHRHLRTLTLLTSLMEAIGDTTPSAEVSRVDVVDEDCDSRIQGDVLVSSENSRARINKYPPTQPPQPALPFLKYWIST
jgi:hypothetical protein